MARKYAFAAAVLLCMSAFVAGQDLGKLLNSGSSTCDSNPCFKEVNMPAICCEAQYLYTLSQGVGAGLSMLHNDTSIICSDACRDIVLGDFKECLIKQLGNYTVQPSLPDDFCGVNCLFDEPELNISERDVYDCGTLEDIPVDCRKNVTKNSKVGPLFMAAFEKCEFDKNEYVDNAGVAGASITLAAAVTAGAAVLIALLA